MSGHEARELGSRNRLGPVVLFWRRNALVSIMLTMRLLETEIEL